MSVFELFLKLPLFAGVESEDLFSLIPKISLEFEDYHAGEVIFKAEERPKGVYYLLSGRAQLISDDVVENFANNSILSFTGLFCDEMTHAADAIAVESSKVFIIDSKSFIYLLKNSTAILCNYIALMSRISDAKKTLRVMSFYNSGNELLSDK